MAQALPAEAIRDSLARVMADPAFQRGIGETLLTRLFRWVGDLLSRVFDLLGDSPPVRWLAIAAIAALVTAVVARLAWLWALERRALARLAAHGGSAAQARADAYAAARAAAARNDFTAAAHLLYQAALVGLARGERLQLHPAKTAGDYARELRGRQSPAALPFRDFARTYDRLVYGTRTVDADGWERLHALASPLLARAA